MIIGYDLGDKDKTAICLRIGDQVHLIDEPFAGPLLAKMQDDEKRIEILESRIRTEEAQHGFSKYVLQRQASRIYGLECAYESARRRADRIAEPVLDQLIKELDGMGVDPKSAGFKFEFVKNSPWDKIKKVFS